MTRNWLPAVLAGALITLSLTACGSDSNGGGSGQAASSLQIWEGYTGDEAKTFAHLVSEYEAAHPA